MFLQYFAEEGITREALATYSQQQNGLSERCNCTVMDPARSMLKHARMPNKLWAEAVSTAVNIKNRLPTRALPNSTPFERWTRKRPDISHLRSRNEVLNEAETKHEQSYRLKRAKATTATATPPGLS
jgi:hypothetical protein